MMTVNESLKSINAYPIPHLTIQEVAEYRGLILTEVVTPEMMNQAAYKLAKADLYIWLSLAPDVSQGGQSYSLTDEQRVQFRNRAVSLQKECGQVTSNYGYKGSRL